MKFVLNGGLILGTLDGANIEIREEIGEDNMIIFGARTEEVEGLRQSVRYAREAQNQELEQDTTLIVVPMQRVAFPCGMRRYRLKPLDPALESVMTALRSGMFGDIKEFNSLLQVLVDGSDHYLVSVDFPSCTPRTREKTLNVTVLTPPLLPRLCLVRLSHSDIKAQEQVDQLYKDRKTWAHKSILCTAGMGKFSSDRTVAEYARDIWHIQVSFGTAEESAQRLADPGPFY